MCGSCSRARSWVWPHSGSWSGASVRAIKITLADATRRFDARHHIWAARPGTRAGRVGSQTESIPGLRTNRTGARQRLGLPNQDAEIHRNPDPILVLSAESAGGATRDGRHRPRSGCAADHPRSADPNTGRRSSSIGCRLTAASSSGPNSRDQGAKRRCSYRHAREPTVNRRRTVSIAAIRSSAPRAARDQHVPPEADGNAGDEHHCAQEHLGPD